jgi:hypothetical protein
MAGCRVRKREVGDHVEAEVKTIRETTGGLGGRNDRHHCAAVDCRVGRKQDASKMEAEDHMDRPDFPTMEQVEKATHEQLARWYRFLPSGDTKEQQKIQDRIAERFKELGGMNPALSKKIGF